MGPGGEVFVGLVILVGILGVVVPVLPGALLVWLAVLGWALVEGNGPGWVVLALATAVLAASQIVKYVVPGRRLHGSGVPRGSLAVGVALAVVGFFLLPVVGMFVGFPAGIYLAERRRLGTHARAWSATGAALRAVGLSVLVELAGTGTAAAVWLVGALAS